MIKREPYKKETFSPTAHIYIHANFEKISKLIVADLNNILNGGKLITADFRKLSFYLNNLWIIRVMNLLRLTYLLRLDVAVCNLKLREKIDELNGFLLHIRTHKAVSDDFKMLIDYFSEQTTVYSRSDNELEKLLLLKSYEMLGDFDTTNRLLKEVIELNYELITSFKKLNQKQSIPTSQLAKDTAAHSVSTLSKIVNGH